MEVSEANPYGDFQTWAAAPIKRGPTSTMCLLWCYNKIRKDGCVALCQDICPDCACIGGIVVIATAPLGCLIGLIGGLLFGLVKWLPGSFHRSKELCEGYCAVIRRNRRPAMSAARWAAKVNEAGTEEQVEHSYFYQRMVQQAMDSDAPIKKRDLVSFGEPPMLLSMQKETLATFGPKFAELEEKFHQMDATVHEVARITAELSEPKKKSRRRRKNNDEDDDEGGGDDEEGDGDDDGE